MLRMSLQVHFTFSVCFFVKCQHANVVKNYTVRTCLNVTYHIQHLIFNATAYKVTSIRITSTRKMIFIEIYKIFFRVFHKRNDIGWRPKKKISFTSNTHWKHSPINAYTKNWFTSEFLLVFLYIYLRALRRNRFRYNS